VGYMSVPSQTFTGVEWAVGSNQRSQQIKLYACYHLHACLCELPLPSHCFELNSAGRHGFKVASALLCVVCSSACLLCC
jgi:hypothetical protein